MARLYGTGCIVGDKKAACITWRREASHRERAIFNSDNKPVLVAVLRLFHDDIRVCLLGKPLVHGIAVQRSVWSLYCLWSTPTARLVFLDKSQ